MANNDEIRKKHALMECDMEIEWQKKVLNSGANESDKAYARQRIAEMEAMKKQIESQK